MKALFAPDVVFFATAPLPLIGRAAIRAYYETASLGLTVTSSLIAAVEQQGVLAIVADVVFDVSELGELQGRLCLPCGMYHAIRLYNLALTSDHS